MIFRKLPALRALSLKFRNALRDLKSKNSLNFHRYEFPAQLQQISAKKTHILNFFALSMSQRDPGATALFDVANRSPWEPLQMYLAATLIRLKRALKDSSTFPFASPLSWKISWRARDLEESFDPLRRVTSCGKFDFLGCRRIYFCRMFLREGATPRLAHSDLAFRKDENDY